MLVAVSARTRSRQSPRRTRGRRSHSALREAGDVHLDAVPTSNQVVLRIVRARLPALGGGGVQRLLALLGRGGDRIRRGRLLEGNLVPGVGLGFGAPALQDRGLPLLAVCSCRGRPFLLRGGSVLVPIGVSMLNLGAEGRPVLTGGVDSEVLGEGDLCGSGWWSNGGFGLSRAYGGGITLYVALRWYPWDTTRLGAGGREGQRLRRPRGPLHPRRTPDERDGQARPRAVRRHGRFHGPISSPRARSLATRSFRASGICHRSGCTCSNAPASPKQA